MPELAETRIQSLSTLSDQARDYMALLANSPEFWKEPNPKGLSIAVKATGNPASILVAGSPNATDQCFRSERASGNFIKSEIFP